MSKDWRTQGRPQTVKVESPDGSTATPEAAVKEIARSAGTERPPRTAVLAIHGMGQQIPFETVDQVQRNFCAAARRQGVELSQPSAQVAKVGDEVLRRAEVRMAEGPNSPEVHFYEAYWAPLTEGRVGLRDVIAFLRGGGGNGLRHSLKISSSWRFMFEKKFPFEPSIANALYLSLALLAVTALVALNAIVLGVAAATNWLPAAPGWLKGAEALQNDLTGVASFVCLIGATFGVCLFFAMMRRDLSQRTRWRLLAPQRFVLDILFFAILLTLIVSAAAMAWLIGAFSGDSFLNLLFVSDNQAEQLATVTTASIILIALIALAGWLFKRILVKTLPSVARLMASVLFYLVLLIAAAAGGYMLALLKGVEVLSFDPRTLPIPLPWLFENRRVWIWATLISLSAFARSFLVQYLGDVAAYVSPHKLDRFNEIRERIRGEVFKTACALYAARSADGTYEYDQVALVSHSLGSVIAYDTLNYLINKDLLSDAPLDIDSRTCLLLTFGSPLDKIAYLFQIQGTRTSDTREALANAVQPLIRSYDYRNFKWINVFSKDDIIGGSLELFDDGTGHPHSVQNEEDPYSSIPLVAHTEFWRTPLVWDHLYAEVKLHLSPTIRTAEYRQREAS